MKILTIIIIMLIIPIAYAKIPEPRDPNSCPDVEIAGVENQCEREQVESSKEIKFVNAYFGFREGSNIKKIEVAPNDGVSTLIVVLANTGHFELAGLRGWLTLPSGFESIDKGRVAFDTFDFNIAPADMIYLEFPIYIKDAKIDLYNTKLYVEYFRVRDLGIQFRNIDIQFRITGKNILDLTSNTEMLEIGDNNIALNIMNLGDAPISAAISTLSSDNLILSSKIFRLGTVEPNGNVTINTKVYVNPSLANTIQTLNIDIAYFDSYGEEKSKRLSREFMIAGSANSIDLRIKSDKEFIKVLHNEELTITISNYGYEEANNVEIIVNNQVGELSIMGERYNLIDKLEGKKTDSINVRLFANENAKGKIFELPLSISYLDSKGGLHKIERSISIYAQGTIALKLYDVGISTIGNVPNISGYLLNEGTDTALFTTIEFEGSSQYIGDLDPNSPTPFAIPIDNREIKGGDISIVYKDDLRNEYKEVLPIDLTYTPTIIQQENMEKGDNSQLITYIIAGVAGIGSIIMYIARKKRTQI
ncbi:MAG: hypothetical protein QXK74_01965 [Candidatus Nitrosocaldaceae archaeon]